MLNETATSKLESTLCCSMMSTLTTLNVAVSTGSNQAFANK
jgi:hypothetical protein